MQMLSKSVLRRGVERFRRALRILDGEHAPPHAQSDEVQRLHQGLRTMNAELARRSLEAPTRWGDGAPREPSAAGAETGASAPAAPVLSGEQPQEEPLGEPKLGDGASPGREARREEAFQVERPPQEPPDADGERAEPVWRLIPHLSSTSSKVISVLSAEGVIRYQSKPIKWLLGYDADDFVGVSLTEFLHIDSRERAEEAVARMAGAEEKFDSWRLQFHTASGGTFWLEGMASNFLNDSRLGGILVYWRELSG